MGASLRPISLISALLLSILIFGKLCSLIEAGGLEDTIGIQTIKIAYNSNSHIMINLTHFPRYPQPNERVTIIAKITGNSSEIKEVILKYREKINYHWYGIHRYWGLYEWTWDPLTWNVYTDWMEKKMTPKGNGVYEAELLELPYYSTVWYQVYAIDNAGNSITSEIQVYNVVRGGKTIFYEIAGDLIKWILYVSVGLLLVKGLGGEKSSKSKNLKRK